jgi:transcriptional regulator with XRE-family HTH domain
LPPILGMDIRETFGANLRSYRLKAQLSQEALAERIGVDRAYISLIERGQQNVTLLTIWHAARALDIRPADLLVELDQKRGTLHRTSLRKGNGSRPDKKTTG